MWLVQLWFDKSSKYFLILLVYSFCSEQFIMQYKFSIISWIFFYMSNLLMWISYSFSPSFYSANFCMLHIFQYFLKIQCDYWLVFYASYITQGELVWWLYNITVNHRLIMKWNFLISKFCFFCLQLYKKQDKM